MTSLGEKLRGARLDQGMDLAEVSARTKIAIKFLEAIEADDRQNLPAGFFYRNWVRQYADSLDLDVGAVTAEVDRVLSADDPLPLPGQSRVPLERAGTLPAPASGGARRMISSFTMLIAVMLGCSGLYAWWRNTQVHASVDSPGVVQAVAPTSAPPADTAERTAVPSAALPLAAPAPTSVPSAAVPSASVPRGKAAPSVTARRPSARSVAPVQRRKVVVAQPPLKRPHAQVRLRRKVQARTPAT